MAWSLVWRRLRPHKATSLLSSYQWQCGGMYKKWKLFSENKNMKQKCFKRLMFQDWNSRTTVLVSEVDELGKLFLRDITIVVSCIFEILLKTFLLCLKDSWTMDFHSALFEATRWIVLYLISLERLVFCHEVSHQQCGTVLLGLSTFR